jgi:hypothetical protein
MILSIASSAKHIGIDERSFTKTLPSGWTYVGCMVDNGLRILSSANQVSASNTPQTCISFCAAQSYALAGVEYGEPNKSYFPENVTEHALPQVKNAGVVVPTTR